MRSFSTLHYGDGYLRVALAAPELFLGDAAANARAQIAAAAAADEKAADLIVFPEHSLCGGTLGDLSFQPVFARQALPALEALVDWSRGRWPLILSAFPLHRGGRLLSLCALLRDGRLLALLPADSNSTGLFPEGQGSLSLFWAGEWRRFPFLSSRRFALAEAPDAVITVVRDGEDAPLPCAEDALLRLLLSSEPAARGRRQRLASDLSSQSRRNLSLDCLISSAAGESGNDHAYSALRLAYEAGECLAASEEFEDDLLVFDADLDYLLLSRAARAKKQDGGVFATDRPVFLAELREESAAASRAVQESSGASACPATGEQNRRLIRPQTPAQFHTKKIPAAVAKGSPAIWPPARPERETLLRPIERLPFVAPSEEARREDAEFCFRVMAEGLRRRLDHIGCRHVVLGLSGGLDSCLALLSCLRAYDLSERPREDILAYSLPGPGSSERTRRQAEALARAAGVGFQEISIEDAMALHFRDIDHDPLLRDLCFENAQARERSQILMDLANKKNGIVVGTGDLSELALGWCTYGGDQMSMFSLNATVPKTLARALLAHEAERLRASAPDLADQLSAVLDTPVSPELLPARDGEIAQKTEEILGPYELHDFFLWHFILRHASPARILRLARQSFAGLYDEALLRRSLETFLRRFVRSQFKRQAMPDGISLGPVNLSAHGFFAMPSDLKEETLLEDF